MQNLQKVKEALAYFMEAEHLKERFGEGIAIDSLRAQGYELGAAALTELNAYIARLESAEFKEALALEIIHTIKESQCSTNI